MSKSQNKQENKLENEKRMTSYDRKLEAKKKQAEIEQRNKKLTWTTVIVICFCIIGIILYTTISSARNKSATLNDAYINIGEHELTQLEYTFYYNYTANSYLNYLSNIGLLSYMGLDTSADFSTQQYSDTLTWKDFFDQMTVSQIQRSKALLDDAKSSGFVYDTTEDYTNFQNSFKESATAASVSIKDYYKAMYGTYATEKNIKPYILDAYTATAYEEELFGQNKPTDEEINQYYEENKDNYDLVDYRSFTFTAEIEDDATEDSIASAMVDLKEKAEAMKAERESGNNFETLCIKYASEDERANYEDEESEYSFTEGTTKSSISNSDMSDWLYEKGRNNGDITIIEDEENYEYYVVEFVQRAYDEDCKETISDELASERSNEYIEGLMVNYEVKDIKGDLYYLTIESKDSEEDTDSTDAEDTDTDDTEDVNTEDAGTDDMDIEDTE